MDLPKLAIGRNLLSDVDKALGREWLVTNSLGGYSSSTVLGINTRKYHGLLVAALNPPINRWILLTKLDEELRIGTQTFALGANEFHDVIYPEGYRYLSSFVLDPFPTFTYEVEGVRLQKTVFMPYMKNATAIIYEVFNPLEEGLSINVSPLVNSRHIYNMTNKNALQWSFLQKRIGNAVLLETSDSISSLVLAPSQNSSFVEESWWVEKLFFRSDAARMESNVDDQFRPGFFSFSVEPKEAKRFHVLAVAGRTSDEAKRLFSSFGKTTEDIETLLREELERRKGLVTHFKERYGALEIDDWLKWLIQAVDSFIVYRASTRRKSVIAGYHWFDDWGRDSLISLPGLTLVTGRFGDAQEILMTFERYCDKGVIPNRFSDKAGDIPLYNTVDATLWFFNAVLQYLKYTGDYTFVQEKLWTTMKEIIEYHLQGTIFGIHMDHDGLITHGPQLTWMDATTPYRFVTPRDGKAVEIQALWYNALKTMELLAKRFNQANKLEKYRSLAEKARASFVQKFWNPKKEYLFDVVGDFGADASLRPNQLIAISLDFPIIDMEMAEKIVDVVWKRLWGTYGLQTLSDTDPRYIGNYLGDWNHRDSAYHNGTVWVWLLGPFTTAFLKTKYHKENWRKFAFKTFLQPLFQEQIQQAGLGTISEIFDGDEPRHPQGCISQAWSVAEPLRAYVEDVVLVRPTYEKEVLANLM
ncbi:MAG: glycogen debranching enzyme N-terminal domain-containing protein, partial [Candidatus Bathyarchaeota archaeon]|nr:glycogen debranching enzyme N-terminal domain-containing protein [Candidatus Bathyarchaeum sp.]